MNMQVIKRSNKTPLPGDIFVIKFNDATFYYGRVVSNTVYLLGIESMILIYIYSEASSEMTKVPNLTKGKLLLPPIITNKRPWTMGYFFTLKNEPLSRFDVLKHHCFYHPFQKCYFDEKSNRLDQKYEPCGSAGIDSFRTIDVMLSRKIGLEPSE